MNAIFGDQFYPRYILDLFKNLCRQWVLRICFSQFFQDTFYTRNAHLGTHMLELIKPNCQAKTGAQKLVFIFNNILNSPLNLRGIWRVLNAIFIRNTPVIALKICKRGVGVYFGTSCYGYALNCLFVYLVILGTRPLFKRKQKLFFFIYMQPRKMKFTFVQINMKQVSYRLMEGESRGGPGWYWRNWQRTTDVSGSSRQLTVKKGAHGD